MIRILYLSFNDPDLSPGVTRKEREFCEFFGRIGKQHDIEFQGFCFVTSLGKNLQSTPFGNFFTVKRIPSLPYRIFCRIPLLRSLFRIRPVFGQTYQEIKTFDPQVILWRYTVTTVPGIFNPKQTCPQALLISEHQSKELEELNMTEAGRILYPLIKRTGEKILGNVDAVLGVTSEISDYECASIGRKIPSFTMTNSIDVNSYPMKTHKILSDDMFRLLYVGSSTTAWHGLDRVLRGMVGYHGKVRLELHLVGNVNVSTRKMICSLGLTDHVISHGYQTGKNLDMLFDICDLGIGTLGIHRKKLTQGSTLKVREYMARGIPFMISHIDDDISPGLPYIFMVNADDSPIDMGEVIRFAKDLYNIYGTELGEMMRAYAVDHMDYRVKIVKLIEFIKSLLPHEFH